MTSERILVFNTLKVRLIALAVLIMIAVIIVWQLQQNLAPKPGETTKPASNSMSMKSFTNGAVPIENAFARRVDSLEQVERETGLSLKKKVPLKLIGRKAQFFLTGNRHVAVMYSNDAMPTTHDLGINIGPRIDAANLASYEQIVQEWQKEGFPITLYKHKGHPGYAEDRGVNHFKGGDAPRPAGIVWMANGVQYMLQGTPKMTLKELISIAELID
jgi:hypothetical protein